MHVLEDWSNDAENSYNSILLYFDQINAALVRTRDVWTVVLIVTSKPTCDVSDLWPTNIHNFCF